ncbi:MAG TPA: hypothetical protein VFP77_02715, partial [Gemmatimonadaceae bacterium]|nr:hypothetical protein [Gemmatimonadaceae bacterium]
MSDHGQDQQSSANIPDWEAIARVLANEGTAEEAGRVRAWLAAHPLDRQLVERLDEAARPQMAGVDVEAALARTHQRMDRSAPPKLTVVRGKPQRTRRVIALSVLSLVAAAIVAVVALRMIPNEHAEVVSSKQYVMTVGQRDSITLPDSSRVILGP